MPSPPGKRTHFPHHCAGPSLEGWLGRGRGRAPMSSWHPDVTQEGGAPAQVWGLSHLPDPGMNDDHTAKQGVSTMKSN